MNNAKKVMPEDIDDEIVTNICLTINTGRHYSQAHLSAWDVKCVLAYLANNPIEFDSDKAWEDFVESGQTTGTGAYTNYIIEKFQRIAFLKKEEELPEEVKALLFDGATSDADYYNKANQRIRAAWKIGAGIK